MLLCEYVLNSMRSPPAEEVIYHTLIQLYLEAQLADESDVSPDGIAASQSTRRCTCHSDRYLLYMACLYVACQGSGMMAFRHWVHSRNKEALQLCSQVIRQI